MSAPVITCINYISVNVMPTSMIQLWVTDFLLTVTDNVTPSDQIEIGMRKCGTGTGFPMDLKGNTIVSVVFECAEVGTQCVEIWARDSAGNQSFCESHVIIQDNLGNCPGSPNWNRVIEICVKTEVVDGVEEAQFVVTGTNPNEPFYANEVTGPDVSCGYFDVPLGSDVTAFPVKDDNPLNGVTTYDIVLISKHYRGIELLNSPYKIIAADANHDGLVTMEDSVELTKLILGIYTELPNSTSWRFIDKSYVFPDPANPFAEVFPESVTFQNIQFPVSADFVAIKVGDVNHTAIANVTSIKAGERAVISEHLSIGLPYPNPTEGGAALPVYLSSAENLLLEISDLAGKLLWVNDFQLEKGNQALEIPASIMSGKGVFVGRLSTEGLVKSGKLIRI